MPFKSKAQQRAMHAKANDGEIDKSVVDEFDEATKKQEGGFAALPERKRRNVGTSKQGKGRRPLKKCEEKEKDAALEIDIEKGDTILAGRFKNSPRVVKSFGTDSNGQPTINGMKLLAIRIEKLMPPKKKKEKKAMDKVAFYAEMLKEACGKAKGKRRGKPMLGMRPKRGKATKKALLHKVTRGQLVNKLLAAVKTAAAHTPN